MMNRTPAENSDTVSLICALLVRFPEIASIRSMPGQVRLTYAIGKRLDRKSQAAIGEDIADHVQSFLRLSGDEGDVEVECESDRSVTFVHVSRDLQSFSKDELVMITGLFAQRFGDTLVRNPDVEEHPDEDPQAQDEIVEYAIEALCDPDQTKNLVGFREEKRVLVYFLKSRKKAKAS
ncbi:MAG: hypothetical protein JO165_12865, partial [Candidatus Eremiobacteraeota bacterium]|nr:hypothetical protein [Candidatus Eremiobacteraeota bacterium]